MQPVYPVIFLPGAQYLVYTGALILVSPGLSKMYPQSQRGFEHSGELRSSDLEILFGITHPGILHPEVLILCVPYTLGLCLIPSFSKLNDIWRGMHITWENLSKVNK